MELRYYQVKCAKKGVDILKDKGIVYLAMEVRCGKTATSMEICKLYGAKKVLFATKKKAISSIKKDYDSFGYSDDFEITVINDESLHKIEDNFDLVIHDEHHRHGSFPKPGKYTKIFKEKYGNLPMIFLSGTPNPESKLQLFHQFWISNKHPFSEGNFYKWHTNLGFIKYKFDLGYGLITNYDSSINTMHKYYGILKRKVKKDDTDRLNYINECMRIDTEQIKKAEEMLDSMVDKYFVTFTQKEAGFTSEIDERILTVPMSAMTYKLCNRLISDRVIQGKGNVILADSAVKLQTKLHQLYSGTIKFEDGNTQVIDDSKAKFIKDYFKDEKIGIFYKFKAEYDMLKNVFGDRLTDKLDEFDSTDKNIALQIVSGREGISLRNAKYLVFLNIDFSAVSYFQARDRLTHMDRLNNTIYWIFSKGGIEEKIYKTVQGKKDFTLSVFRKHYKT